MSAHQGVLLPRIIPFPFLDSEKNKNKATVAFILLLQPFNNHQVQGPIVWLDWKKYEHWLYSHFHIFVIIYLFFQKVISFS